MTTVPDLRTVELQDLLRVAERVLDTAVVCADQAVVKRRSVGAPTSRATWVRVSVCALAAAAERGGLETTAALPPEVPAPRWFRGHVWADGGLVWRAEETELVPVSPIQSGGVLTADPGLSTKWWQQLRTALQALATVDTARVATPHTCPVTAQRVQDTIAASAVGLDVELDEWTVAHADLSWPNLTADPLWILDWEDVGRGPRGWDAATLWAASLAVPALADRVQEVFAADLQARTGLVCQLYQVAELLQAGLDYAGPLFAPAQAARERLISELTRRR